VDHRHNATVARKARTVNDAQLHNGWRQTQPAAPRRTQRARPSWSWFTLAVLVVGLFTGPAASAADDPRVAFFESRIRPVLVRSCYKCHSQHSDQLQSDLRLDVGLTKAARLITPGEPDSSRLIQAIRYTDSELQMPPSGRLPAAVIADFETWIRMGAIDPRPADTSLTDSRKPRKLDLEAGRRFWAFQPLQKPDWPTIDDPWIQSPIDALILKRLQAAGLAPGKRADRRTLIRRASFVLTGLPPTPQAVQKFLRDRRPDAFARLVDDLLASPAYGERWGRHWLDVVRYGDCNGADESRPFPHAYHFRNYVIDTFNRDVPYDRMIAEHLAGDLLQHDGRGAYEPLVGTGFLVLGTKILAEQDETKMRVDIIDEQIDAFSRALLGLTVACARCHDHKFDPIPTSDYYALAGIFQSTRTMATPGQWQELPAHTAASLAAARQFGATLEAQQAELKRLQEQTQQALKTADAIELEAESFTRGNVTVDTTNYGKGIGIIGDSGNGKLHFAEYDIPIPRAGKYLLQFRYAAAAARPGKILLNGQVARETAISQVTGDWYPPGQRWHSEGVHTLAAGMNTFRVQSGPNMSHIDKLRLIRIDGQTSVSALLARRDKQATRVSQIEQRIKPPLRVMAVSEGQVTSTRLHLRGNHLKLGAEVPRRFLQVIAGSEQPALPADHSGRLQLARWLTRPDHPLTSRVMVNRLWHWHFGRGLVATTDNFGALGARPTHPRLLDYLARRLIEHNWSLKAMHREIVLSSTWQLDTPEHSSPTSQASRAVDPENRLYWSGTRRRLEAEALRDAMLLIADRLEKRIGGAPLTLKTIALSPEDLEKQQEFYDTSNRRTVYLPVLRTNVYDFLTLFDFANPDLPTGSRVTTIVPTQALLMMNSPLVQDCARRLATAVLQDQQLDSDADRLKSTFERLFSRPPEQSEQALGLRFVRDFAALDVAGPDDTPRRLAAWTALCETLLASNDFVYLR